MWALPFPSIIVTQFLTLRIYTDMLLVVNEGKYYQHYVKGMWLRQNEVVNLLGIAIHGAEMH